MKKLILTLAAMLAFAASAVETSIAYQGVLKNAAGTEAVTGPQNITFRLYNQPTGGAPLWERMMPVSLDDNGLFNVELADDSKAADTNAVHLVDALKMAREGSLYIGLEVKDSAGEILPRQKILMVPYASYAADVSNASGEFVVAGKATIKTAEIGGDFVARGNAEFNGEATFSRGVTFSGNMTVKNSGTISGYGTIPVGGIIMWSGSTVPDGWALCNGSNGTPDLRNRFIVGSNIVKANGFYQTGEKGGADTVTLNENQIPSHRHNYVGDDQIEGIESGCSSKIKVTSRSYDASSYLDQGHKSGVYGTSYAGGGQSHENRPPYYALAFIMRVK